MHWRMSDEPHLTLPQTVIVHSSLRPLGPAHSTVPGPQGTQAERRERSCGAGWGSHCWGVASGRALHPCSPDATNRLKLDLKVQELIMLPSGMPCWVGVGHSECGIFCASICSAPKCVYYENLSQGLCRSLWRRKATAKRVKRARRNSEIHICLHTFAA